MNHLHDLLEVVTVGLPFCAFKLITGKLLFFTTGMKVMGGILLVLGALDLIINLVNVLFLVWKKRRGATICTLTLLVKLWTDGSGAGKARLTDVAASLDVILSFLLVVAMIDSGRLSGLPHVEGMAWNIAVSFNVLGAGMAQLSRSIRKLNGTESDNAEKAG